MNEDEKKKFYGATAQEWLDRWDEGQTVWSVEMGGTGPGYEQAIQITATEILRHLLKEGYDPSKWDDGHWEKDRDKIKNFGQSDEKIKSLRLSGAQWGGAMSLALHLYRKPPYICLVDEQIQDRKIQVSKDFPSFSERL